MSSSEPPPFPQDELNPYAPPRSEVGPEMLLPSDLRPMPFTIGDVLLRSWEIYRDRMGNCIGVVMSWVVMHLLAQLALSGAMQAAQHARNPLATWVVVAVVGTLAILVFQTWIYIGMILVMLDIGRGREAVFGDMFSGGRLILPAVLANILFRLMVAATMALGVFPGGVVWGAVGNNSPAGPIALALGLGAGFVVTIFLMLRLSQFSNLIIDRNAGVLDSFQISWQITRGNAGLIFVLGLLAVALNVGGFLMCLIGLIFTAPFTVLLFVVTYLALTGQPTADPYSKGEPLAELEPL